MGKIVYRIVEHDGGWAYTLDGVYSETFRSHDEAFAAARRAAAEQQVPGSSEEIEYETAQGKWKVEHSDGSDRPSTEVTD